MSFQEQLLALISDDKKKDAEPIMTAMTKTFQDYATDIAELKTKIRSSEGVKPEEFAKLEQRLKETETTISTSENELKKYKKLYEDTNNKLVETYKRLTETSIEKEVRRAMSVFKIAPDSVDQVFDLISHTVKVKDDGSFIVGIKDKEGKDTELSVKDYMEKTWAVTPFAKRVLLADFSSGGGSDNQINGHTTGKKWREMTLDEQGKLYKENPTLAQQLAAVK